MSSRTFGASLLNKPTYLGLNIASLVITVGAAVGAAVALCNHNTGKPYAKIYGAVILAAAFSIVGHILELVLFMGYGFFELGQASEFFMFTSPSLVWIPFFEILAAASMPRLRVERPGRFQWPIVITGIAYFWTIVMIVLSIIMAATDLPITAFILCLCMLVYFGLYIVGATISYQDARPLGWWFVLYAFLVLLNIAGSITISKLMVASLGQSVYAQLVYIILFKFMGGLSLLLLVIMFPYSWVKHIQSSKSQYKLTSSRVPADEEAPFA